MSQDRRRNEACRPVESPRRHLHRTVLGRICLALAVVLGLAAGAGLLRPQPAVATAGAPHDTAIHFIFLGDIWKYDFTTGKATMEVDSRAEKLGDLSWSRNGEALAWTTEPAMPEGHFVVYRETVSDPHGAVTTHTLPDAYAPAVSPDGTMCLYETSLVDGPHLRVYDALHDTTSDIPGLAASGTWVDATQPTIAFNRTAQFWYSSASPGSWFGGINNAGYFTRNLATGVEAQVPVVYPGETPEESNVSFPQGDSDSGTVALSKYLSSGETDVVVTNGTAATKVANASGVHNDVLAYRWAFVDAGSPSALNNPALFVEVDSSYIYAQNHRPDIYRVSWNGSTPTLVPAFRACSLWGQNALRGATFTDVDRTNKYYKAITYMWMSQMIEGFGDKTFRSNDVIKRAQFAKMIDGALYLSVTEELKAEFTDLGPDPGENDPHLISLYPNDYVAAAAQNQLVLGYPDGTFRPYVSITRAQVLTMVVRAAQRYVSGGLQTPPSDWSGELSGFADPDHGDNVHKAEYNGLLAGIDLKGWSPAGTANRGEVAQILYNLMAAVGPTFPAAQ